MWYNKGKMSGVEGEFFSRRQPGVGGDFHRRGERDIDGHIGGGRDVAGHIEGGMEPEIEATPGDRLVSVVPAKIGGKDFYIVVMDKGIQQSMPESDAHLFAHYIDTHFSPATAEIEADLEPNEKINGVRYNPRTGKMSYTTEKTMTKRERIQFWKKRTVTKTQPPRLHPINFDNILAGLSTYNTELEEGIAAEPFGGVSHFKKPSEEKLERLKKLYSDEAAFDALSEYEKNLDRTDMEAILFKLQEKRASENLDIDTQILTKADASEVKIRNPKMATIAEDDYPDHGKHCIMVPCKTKKDEPQKYAAFTLDFTTNQILYFNPQGETIDEAKLSTFAEKLSDLFDPDTPPDIPDEITDITGDPLDRPHYIAEFFARATLPDADLDLATPDPDNRTPYFDLMSDILS